MGCGGSGRSEILKVLPIEDSHSAIGMKYEMASWSNPIPATGGNTATHPSGLD